jgi:hypothetical protein
MKQGITMAFLAFGWVQHIQSLSPNLQSLRKHIVRRLLYIFFMPFSFVFTGTHTLRNGNIGRGDVFSDPVATQANGGHHVPSMHIMTRNGKGIGLSTGPYWRKVRGRLVHHITSKRAAEANADIVLEEVCSAISEFRRKILHGENLDNLNQQLKRESMNFAMRVLFNKRYGAKATQDFKDLVFCVEWFFCNLSSGNPSDMIPALRVLPNAFLREVDRITCLRDKVLSQLISAHRAEWEELRRKGKMAFRNQARGMVDQFFFDCEDDILTGKQDFRSSPCR